MTGNSVLLMMGLLIGGINIPIVAMNWVMAGVGRGAIAWGNATVGCVAAMAWLGIWADAIRLYFGWQI